MTLLAADDWIRDVRHGLRGLWRTPAFTLVATLTLGLGVGAVTVIYSVVYNVVGSGLGARGSGLGARGSGLGKILDQEEQGANFMAVASE